MASQSLTPLSSDVSLPFPTTTVATTQSISDISSSDSIPPLSPLQYFFPLHSVAPSIRLDSSIGQIGLPSFPSIGQIGLGREYDTLVGIITHYSGQLSLEELRTKLLLHDQRLQRLKELDLVVSHQAFAAQNVSPNSSFVSGNQSISQGGRGRGRSYSSRGRGRGGRGRGFFGGRGQSKQVSSPNNFSRNGFHGQSSSGIGSNSHVSYHSQSTSSTSPSAEVLGAHPSSTICQICGSPGHSALQCTNRFNHAFVANDLPKSFATMSFGETNDATWYFDSAASAHMTPSEGLFKRKSRG
ncbi:uncharacterized protein LOC107770174 [Nicotiana tabacum]|uniref:Uncharacterized protein LOC107770174 n=1 Tax=Nicotiana tabacum TaxID=4097 RepID=A0AC58SJM6_TOBAC